MMTMPLAAAFLPLLATAASLAVLLCCDQVIAQEGATNEEPADDRQ